MTSNHWHDADAQGEIRRLNKRADQLDRLGQGDQAAGLRIEAIALAAAETQRLAALADANAQTAQVLERLHYAWETIEPRDSFAWFIEHCDDHAVVALHAELKRQKMRVLILETTRA